MAKQPNGMQSPPSEAPAGWRPTWTEEAEAYLLSNGWVRQGTNRAGMSMWDDGLAYGEPVLKPQIILPKKNSPDGEIVHQLVCPPIRWLQPLDMAFRIQKSRDEEKTGLALRIASKERELAALKEQQAKEETPKEKVA